MTCLKQTLQTAGQQVAPFFQTLVGVVLNLLQLIGNGHALLVELLLFLGGGKVEGTQHMGAVGGGLDGFSVFFCGIALLLLGSIGLSFGTQTRSLGLQTLTLYSCLLGRQQQLVGTLLTNLSHQGVVLSLHVQTDFHLLHSQTEGHVLARIASTNQAVGTLDGIFLQP